MADARNTGTGVSRRTVAKGLAWSVPVVVVATAAPAHAASGVPPKVTITSACKYPGNSCRPRPKGYSFFGTVANGDLNKAIYVYSVTISSVGTDLAFQLSVPAVPFQVPAGATIPVEFYASSSNSANQSFVATITVTWGHSPTPPDPDNHPPIVTQFTVPATPPDCNCPG
jgi:hypothetical protein